MAVSRCDNIELAKLFILGIIDHIISRQHCSCLRELVGTAKIAHSMEVFLLQRLNNTVNAVLHVHVSLMQRFSLYQCPCSTQTD